MFYEAVESFGIYGGMLAPDKVERKVKWVSRFPTQESRNHT